MAVAGGAAAVAALGAIVNAGKSTWDIIKDGAAESGAASSFCSAVPKNVKFTDLSGWSAKSKSWRIKLTNGWGMDCVDIELVWSFQHNGEAKTVPGSRFVNNFTVYAKSCKVLWGYKANVNATVKGNPLNGAGSGNPPIGIAPLLISSAGA